MLHYFIKVELIFYVLHLLYETIRDKIEYLDAARSYYVILSDEQLN